MPVISPECGVTPSQHRTWPPWRRAHVELLHEGLFGRDPIALKVDDMRVALRRKEAASLTVDLAGAGAAGAAE